MIPSFFCRDLSDDTVKFRQKKQCIYAIIIRKRGVGI